jgi:hypothetical protein
MKRIFSMLAKRDTLLVTNVVEQKKTLKSILGQHQFHPKYLTSGAPVFQSASVISDLGQRRLSPRLARDLHCCNHHSTMPTIKQQTLAMAADQTFEIYRKPTRRDEFLKTMEAIVPCSALCEVIEPHYPKTGNDRPTIGLERIRFIQHWFNL